MNSENTFEPAEFSCPNCGEKIDIPATLCPNCNSILGRVDEKLSKELIKGRTLTRIILGSSFSLILIANILGAIIPNLQPSIGGVITVILLALVYFLFYKGFNFARWITIAFLGIAGIAGIKLGISLLSKSWFVLIEIVLATIYVGFSVILIIAKPIKYFQEYQRKKRKMSQEN